VSKATPASSPIFTSPRPPAPRAAQLAGQTIHVPCGVVHSSSNIGTSPGRRRIVIFSPGGTERFFLEVGASAPDADVDLAAALAAATRHGWEFIAQQGPAA